jgi:hypothetical protein
MSVGDRLVVGRGLWLGAEREEDPLLESWRPSGHGRPARSSRGVISRMASRPDAFSTRQIEAGEFADHGVAAYADVGGNFAA